MRCPSCNRFALDATLVNNYHLRCADCSEFIPVKHNTNYNEIVNFNRGICPFCGENKESFARIPEGFRVCTSCGRKFLVDEKASTHDFSKDIIEDGKWVDNILLTGLILSSGSLIGRVFGASEVNFLDFTFPMEAFHWILIVLTLAHWYAAWLLNRAIFNYWSKSTLEECNKVLSEVTATGGIFVRGFSPRTKSRSILGRFTIYEMDVSDPSTWATYIFALIVLMSFMPFDNKPLLDYLIYIFLALFIIIINWTIGSSWIISLSELSVPRSKSTYLSKKAPGNKDGRNVLMLLLMIIILAVSYVLVNWITGSIILLISIVTLIIVSVNIVLEMGFASGAVPNYKPTKVMNFLLIGSLIAIVSVIGIGIILFLKNSFPVIMNNLPIILFILALLVVPFSLKGLTKIRIAGKYLYVIISVLVDVIIVVVYWNWA